VTNENMIFHIEEMLLHIVSIVCPKLLVTTYHN